MTASSIFGADHDFDERADLAIGCCCTVYHSDMHICQPNQAVQDRGCADGDLSRSMLREGMRHYGCARRKTKLYLASSSYH